MTYGRFLKPRFYMDNFNWLASRGKSRNSMIDIVSGAGYVALNSGYTKYQMFDMNPLNQASFDSNGGTATVLITIDYGVTAMPTNFIAIMNHNLKSADGKLRVAHDTSPIVAVSGGTTASLVEVLNGDVSGSYATPAADYDTLLTFASSDDRYWSIEFIDVATWDADLLIGNIMLGEYYTMPNSPDMPTTKGTVFDGVNVVKAFGGRSFGVANWTAANGGTYTAFRSDTFFRKSPGRETYDLTHSYVNDTDIYPSDRFRPRDSVNFLNDVISRSSMELIPFIFTPDSKSTTTGDYMFSRFDQDSFVTTMPSANVTIFSARIVQEF